VIGYAARECFTPADLTAYVRARAMVKMMPEGHTCHEVAAAVGSVLGLSPVKGTYGGFDHSWLVLPSGHVLDVYAPGRLPPVQLVHVGAYALPESGLYVPDT
jgi:hypothetical protein